MMLKRRCAEPRDPGAVAVRMLGPIWERWCRFRRAYFRVHAKAAYKAPNVTNSGRFTGRTESKWDVARFGNNAKGMQGTRRVSLDR